MRNKKAVTNEVAWFHFVTAFSFKRESSMFGLFTKKKNVNELESIIAEIESNMQNNYKDVAQAAFREFEQKLSELIEQGKLSEGKQEEYNKKLAMYKEKLKAYSHKDQKPYWTND